MKRVLPIWFLAAVLGGCGLSDGFAPPDTSMSSAHREVNLTLRHTFIEDRKQSQLRILSDIVDQLENEHPGLNIEMEGIQDTVHRDQKLPAEMVQGNPPDIFDLFGGSDTKRYARAGMLLDLTPFLKDMGWSDYFVNLEEFTVDGRVYGLPIAGYAEGVFYNKALFRTHGWDVPATWDDLLAIVEEAKAAGVQPFALAARDGWVNGMMWNTIMIRTAGMDHFKGLLSGESKWTDEEFVRAFEHYETLVDMGAFPEGALGLPADEQGEMFLEGNTAMVFTGSWDAVTFSGVKAEEMSGKVGFFNFPAIPDGLGDPHSINASYSNGWGFSSKLTEKEKRVVHAFIKLTFSQEMFKRRLMESNLLPSVQLEDTRGVDPLLGEIIRTINRASGTWKAYDAIVQPTVKVEIDNALQSLIARASSPREVAARLQKVQEEANRQMNE